MVKGPLLMHAWQVNTSTQDEDGEEALRKAESLVAAKKYLIPVSSAQWQLESLIWQRCVSDYPTVLNSAILQGLIRALLGELFAKINPWAKIKQQSSRDSKEFSAKLAQRVESFIEANLKSPITLADLESHFHYTSRHLNRIFQQHYHNSIGNYLRQRRMELAERWLVTTDRSVKDIAFSLGYQNVSQFCRYFASQNGVSPTQFRKNYAQRIPLDINSLKKPATLKS